MKSCDLEEIVKKINKLKKEHPEEYENFRNDNWWQF